MSAGSRRADGRARLMPTGIEMVGVAFDLVLLLVLIILGLDLVGVTDTRAIIANATLAAFVGAGLLTVASLIVENIKEARTGTHSANRREDVAPEVTRDVLSEALAAIEESETKFRDEHPEVFYVPPAEAEEFDDPDYAYTDLPDFARPVAPPTAPPTRAPQPVP